MTKKKTAEATPYTRDDSIIGMIVPCLIVDYHSPSGTVIAQPTDFDIFHRAREQCQEVAMTTMRSKLMHEGYPQRQSIAIAMSKAGKKKKKR